MKTLLKNRKGVTLVELLAVLVILGIIAAIAIPTIGNLIDNSRERAADAEWDNITSSAITYATAQEPGTTFSIQNMIDNDFLIIDEDFTIEDAETGGTTWLDQAIFDQNGNLVLDPEDEIWINGYNVYTEPAA
jgi:type IV pilus assembly protein PilA